MTDMRAHTGVVIDLESHVTGSEAVARELGKYISVGKIRTVNIQDKGEIRYGTSHNSGNTFLYRYVCVSG